MMVIHRNGKFAAVMWTGNGQRFYRLGAGAVWEPAETLEAALA